LHKQHVKRGDYLFEFQTKIIEIPPFVISNPW
jgi:hypothetical protein